MILGLSYQQNAQWHYRLRIPLSACGPVRLRTLAGVTTDDLAGVHTVVIQGIGGRARDVRRLLQRIRAHGVQRILVDYDDAIFEPHPFRPVRANTNALPGVRAALRNADGVIVTTDALRDHFAPYTDLPIAVVPNLIDAAEWPEPHPVETPPVVVVGGSPSHHYDWDAVIPALLWVRQSAPDVRIRLMGYGHPTIRRIATEGVNWCSPGVYHRALHGATIGLCPLPDTPFNRGKTPVKAMEYALSGMAVIASPLLYAPLLTGGRGYLVPDGDLRGWAMCIAFYLAHPDVRQHHATALRHHILSTLDVRQWAAHLTAIYTGDTPWHFCLKEATALFRSGQPMH